MARWMRSKDMAEWDEVGLLEDEEDEEEELEEEAEDLEDEDDFDDEDDEFELCPLPALESFRHENKFVVRVDLPGLNRQEIHLQASSGGYMVIQGERKRAATPRQDRFFAKEVCYGAFERSVPLPEGLKMDQIEAEYENGILEIKAPWEREAPPKKIEVMERD